MISIFLWQPLWCQLQPAWGCRRKISHWVIPSPASRRKDPGIEFWQKLFQALSHNKKLFFQIVNYKADSTGYGGYIADVKYDGKAVYKPAPKPVYKPKPYHA